MTVYRDSTEPTGRYSDGYDTGCADAIQGRPAQWTKPRSSRASAFRFGYADGYADGQQRALEEPRDDFGRPLGMYDYNDLSAADKKRHDAYYHPEAVA